MFMKDNRKKNVAAIIISKMKPNGEMESETKKAPETEEGTRSDYSMGMESAAEEIIAAVETKDAKKLVNAAKALVSMIKDEHEDDERSNS